jgi:hypothetical protein
MDRFLSNVERMNKTLQFADDWFVSTEKLKVEAPDLSGVQSVIDGLVQPGKPEEELREEKEDAEGPPESFDADGLAWFREDVDFIDAPEGTTFYSRFYRGAEYKSVVPSVPSSNGGNKGKANVNTLPTFTTSPPEVPLASKPKVPKTVGKATKQTDVERDNPLHVKSAPKSAALSDEQRNTLRRFFNLPEGKVPAQEWAAMTPAAKSAELKARSIPRWATDAVLRSNDNLPLILNGTVTKENHSSVAKGATFKGGNRTSQAFEAWQNLKSDFKGTTLWDKPYTQKEKAFRKRFYQLLVDFGPQVCFPKLRSRPDQQGQASGRNVRNTGPLGGLGDFVSMAEAIGQISRAFNAR